MTYSELIDLAEQQLFSCSVRQLTGVSCPGCGMQRALIALLRGDLSASFSANPALIPLLFTVGYTLLHLRFGFTRGPRIVLILFCITVSLMIVNYIGSSLLLRYL